MNLGLQFRWWLIYLLVGDRSVACNLIVSDEGIRPKHRYIMTVNCTYDNAELLRHDTADT